MKKILKFAIESLTGFKVHSDHTDIKGKKSGGVRDSNGKDWKKKKPNSVNYDVN